MIRSSRRRKLAVDDDCLAIIRSWHQRVFIKDHNLVYLACSPAFADCLGLRPGELTGKLDSELFSKEAEEKRSAADRSALTTGYHEEDAEEYPMNGKPAVFRTVRTAIRDPNGSTLGVMGMLVDDAGRKHAESSQKLLLKLLALINTSADVEELLGDLVGLIKRHTGAHAVGVRLARSENYPFVAAVGLSPKFRETDGDLIVKGADGKAMFDRAGFVQLDCMCGRVIRGATISSRPYYTEGGSFWTNNTKDFLPFMEKLESCPRKRLTCAAAGLLSLAIVPLISGLEVVGVLVLGDTRPDFFTLADIRFFEKIASSIGNAVRKIEAETALQESNARLQEALANLEKSRASVISQERLSAIGQLAGGVAHDFNNILMSMVGFTEIALLSAPAKSDQRECLEYILSSGKRAKDIIAQIMTISRRSQPDLKPIKLQNAVADSMKLIRAGIPSTIEFTMKADASCGYVLADATLIHQVIMNLAANARDAMGPRGGAIEVEVAPFISNVGFLDRHKQCRATTYTRVTVTDNGEGMDEGTMARIFEPYFTTKEKGKGTGLGLATVHSIMLSLGAAIEVRSTVGKGTSFDLYFPVHRDAPAARDSENAAPQKIRVGSERILLVDDEESLLRVGSTMLRQMGYTVATFDNSELALRKFQEDPGQFDLVITDHTMPKLTGVMLAARIREIRPSMPVLLCSGFSSETVSKAMVEDAGICGQLRKPYSMFDLSDIVRQTLDARNDT